MLPLKGEITIQIIGSSPCQDHGHVSLYVLTDISVDSEWLTPELVPDFLPCFPQNPLQLGLRI